MFEVRQDGNCVCNDTPLPFKASRAPQNGTSPTHLNLSTFPEIIPRRAAYTMDTRNKTIVFITGANSGIGYETVKALLQSTRSYHIFLGSRSLERGHEAATTLRLEVPESLSSIEVIEIDVSSDESIAAAYGALKGDRGHIDVLVNNAGMSVYRYPTSRSDAVSRPIA